MSWRYPSSGELSNILAGAVLLKAPSLWGDATQPQMLAQNRSETAERHEGCGVL